MEKLSMCRICTVENVRMHEVSKKNLQEIYEKLTDIPFITEDSRPMLACYFCYAKLQQCCRFKKQCLDADKLFAQMLNSCERISFINRGNPKFVGGFVKTPVENISIVDDGLAGAGAIEIELPPVSAVPTGSERPYQFIEVKVEHESDELEPEYPANIYPDVEDFPAHHSRSDSEDDVPLLKIKTEVEQVKDEEQQEKVDEDKRKADNTEYHRSYVKQKLKKTSDGGTKSHDGGAGFYDQNQRTSQNEIDDITKRKKLQNKIRCQRYRANLKNKNDAILCTQNTHRTITAEEEEKNKRRKERNKRNSQRYRDKKRANNLNNAHPDQSSKKIIWNVSKFQNVHNLQIAGSSKINMQ